MKFWETLPEDVYRAWQSNKFKAKAIPRIEADQGPQMEEPSPFRLAAQAGMFDPAGAAQPMGMGLPGAPPAMSPLLPPASPMSAAPVIAGAAPGGEVMSRFRRKASQVLRTIGGGVKDAYNVYDDTAEGLAGQFLSNLNFDYNDSPGSMSEARRYYREANHPGPDSLMRFGARVATDPANLLPLGRGVSLASKGVSRLPGAAAVGAGLRSAGTAAKDAPGIRTLLQPSVATRARRAGEEVFDVIRQNLDKYSTGGIADTAPGRFRYAYDFGVNKRVAPLLDETVPGVGKTLRTVYEDAATTPGQFADAARRTAETRARGTIEAGIKAEHEAMPWLQRQALDLPAKAFRNKWGRGPSLEDISRGISGMILGTPGYPLGNITEDSYRMASAGVRPSRVGAQEFAARTKGFPGMPSDLYSDESAGAAVQMLGGSRKNIGPSFNMPRVSLPGGRAVGGNEVHPANLLTGRTWLNMAGEAGANRRRAYLVQKLDQATAKGMSPTDAAKAVLKEYGKDFPRYGADTSLDAAAKAIFPFWGYETQRWPYIAREVLKRPQVAQHYETFNSETDKGYIPVGFGMEVNPLRGTVLNAPSVFNKPDYPTYTTGKSGKVEEVTTLLGKAGFYPSTPVNAAIAIGRGMEGQPPEWGQLLPNTAKAPLNLAQAAGATGIPGLTHLGELATNFEDAYASDRFSEYAVAKELALMGVNPEEATPAQRQDAIERTGARQALMTEAGVLRHKPQEEKDYREELVAAAIRAGVPEEAARAAQKTGNPISARDAQGVPYLNAAKRREVYAENEQWEPWRQVTEPLKRPSERAALEETRGYFKELDAIDTDTQQQLRRLYNAYNNGDISGEAFRKARTRIMTTARGRREQSRGRAEERGALVDAAAREAFYAKTGREPLGERPEDEAARRFFDIDVQEDVAGQPNFEQFYADRDAFLAGLDEGTRKYITEQYPRKKFADDPVVFEGEAKYKSLMDEYRGYLNDVPRWRGIPAEEQKDVAQASAELQALRQLYPGRPTGSLIAMIRERNPVGARYLWTLSQRANPDRRRFMQERPELLRLLEDVVLPEFLQ